MSELFDRSRLIVKPLGERVHDIDMATIIPLGPRTWRHPSIEAVSDRIKAARLAGGAVILMMGGHVIRSGSQRFIIDLMERGLITCLAMNGSCVIHDYEYALIGATTESVAKYIMEGQFGIWRETGRINDIINEAYAGGPSEIGIGGAVGQAILDGEFPHKDISVLAAARRLGIPATVHVGIGYDIIHEMPNCDGAAIGALSYRDFLRFARVLDGLQGGVVMNFGSAVMAPEVYLKALSMARNVAHQEGRSINKFTTLVCDLQSLPQDISREPSKSCSGYYFRPWKTMLVRTVADGGESFYVHGTHADTIPALWKSAAGEAR